MAGVRSRIERKHFRVDVAKIKRPQQFLMARIPDSALHR